MTRRRLWGWVALAASALLLLGGAALLFRGSAVQPPMQSVVDIPCPDIVAGCGLAAPQLHVRFDTEPQAMKPFQLHVQVAGAVAVHAGFAMRGMQMGMNRYRLLPDGTGAAWRAEVTLPVCMQGRGDWEMLLDIDDRRYRLAFTSR